MRFQNRLVLFCALAATSVTSAQPVRPALKGADAMLASLDKSAPHWTTVEQQIWAFAEVGYQEVKSSALQQAEATAAGFKCSGVYNSLDMAPTMIVPLSMQ